MINVKSNRLKRREVEREDQRARESLHQSMLTTGLKGFSVLNGAGVAATLGFIQAVAGKPEFVTFKLWGLAALGMFLVGSVASFVAFLPLSHALNSAKDMPTEGNQARSIFASAFVAVVFGATFLWVGIFKAF